MAKQETLLYLEIAEAIRLLIASGEWQPGDKLPPVRELAQRWHCTPGTVNRAYAKLAQEGLVVGHRGSGTRVASTPFRAEPPAWRWAALVNRAEDFLLQTISRGYTPAQAQAALALAIARWQELQARGAPQPPPAVAHQLRFVGSHDLVVELLPRLIAEHAPTVSLSLQYVGSLGGLMALARNEADVAGIHLWDVLTNTYNVPFVQRVLPGRRLVLLGLVYRFLGLILPPGNPQGLHSLADLTGPAVQLVNRQPGSGTRVWLDAQLKTLGIAAPAVPGYERAELTHLAVAHAVARGEATVGLGIQAAAAAYGLDFVPLTKERYDLVLPAETWDSAPAQALVQAIRAPRFRETVLSLGGYDLTASGEETWIS